MKTPLGLAHTRPAHSKRRAEQDRGDAGGALDRFLRPDQLALDESGRPENEPGMRVAVIADLVAASRDIARACLGVFPVSWEPWIR